MVEERYNLILENEQYRKYLKKNTRYEKDRKFCRHNLQHFLDVARIAYIINLEKNLQFDKGMIYAAALLHDIGRWRQYKEGVPHEEASAELAGDILRQCGYSCEEIKVICSAILNHRRQSGNNASLNNVIYEGDKLSRNCFDCAAYDECNWTSAKKNTRIKY